MDWIDKLSERLHVKYYERFQLHTSIPLVALQSKMNKKRSLFIVLRQSDKHYKIGRLRQDGQTKTSWG